MGSTLSGVIYFGAPIDDYTDYTHEDGLIDKTPSWAARTSDPDDENYDEDATEREWDEVWAERKYGWIGDAPYADENDDPEGYQKWSVQLDERYRLEREEFQVEIDWCGELEWDETPQYVAIKVSQKQAMDGESLMLTTDSVTDAQRDDWVELLREFVRVMELPVSEPFAWRLTACRS